MVYVNVSNARDFLIVTPQLCLWCQSFQVLKVEKICSQTSFEKQLLKAGKNIFTQKVSKNIFEGFERWSLLARDHQWPDTGLLPPPPGAGLQEQRHPVTPPCPPPCHPSLSPLPVTPPCHPSLSPSPSGASRWEHPSLSGGGHAETMVLRTEFICHAIYL